MPHLDEINRSIGVLQATISVGFQAVHHRMDDRDRFTLERHREVMGHIRHLNYRLDKKRNGNGGNGRIPYAKIAALLGLIILGVLGHMAPEATKAGVGKMLPAVVRELLGALAASG